MEQQHDDGKTVIIELKQDADAANKTPEEDITLTHSSLYPAHKRPAGVFRNPILLAGILLALLIAAVFLLLSGIGKGKTPADSTAYPPTGTEPATSPSTAPASGGETTPNTEPVNPALPRVTGLPEAATVADSVTSDFVLVADADTLKAISARNANEKMYPASLTKIMTFLVAYDKLPDRTKKLTLTKDIKNSYPEGSRVGIDVGDILTVEQCMYAMLLESDTDAVLLLVRETAGTEAAFARLMNEKAAALGLVSTHFENATGLHAAAHYTTPAEMAVIFATALENDLFRAIITTEKYATYLGYLNKGVSDTYRMTFFNGTLVGRFANNNLSTKLAHGITVLGGKTGLTDEAAYCQAALASGADGKEYIAILGHAQSAKQSALDTSRALTTAID